LKSRGGNVAALSLWVVGTFAGARFERPPPVDFAAPVMHRARVGISQNCGAIATPANNLTQKALNA
jgi:hypothetical protein